MEFEIFCVDIRRISCQIHPLTLYTTLVKKWEKLEKININYLKYNSKHFQDNFIWETISAGDIFTFLDERYIIEYLQLPQLTKYYKTFFRKYFHQRKILEIIVHQLNLDLMIMCIDAFDIPETLVCAITDTFEMRIHYHQKRNFILGVQQHFNSMRSQ